MHIFTFWKRNALASTSLQWKGQRSAAFSAIWSQKILILETLIINFREQRLESAARNLWARGGKSDIRKYEAINAALFICYCVSEKVFRLHWHALDDTAGWKVIHFKMSEAIFTQLWIIPFFYDGVLLSFGIIRGLEIWMQFTDLFQSKRWAN